MTIQRNTPCARLARPCLARGVGALGLAATAAALTVAPTAAATAKSTAAARNTAAAKSTAMYRLPTIVARVNGQPVTRDELDSEIERSYGKQVLFTVVLTRLLNERAAQQHLTPTAAQLESAYRAANQQSQGRLPMILEEGHLTKAQFESQILRPKLEMDAMQRQGVVVTNAEIQKYFDANKSMWATPEMVNLYRIRVANLDTAKQVKADADKGVAWADLVKKYDTDPAYYKDHDGQYGPVPRAQLQPELAAAIAKLKPNEVTDPMEAPEQAATASYVVWRYGGVVPPKSPTLDAHKAEIRSILTQQKLKSPDDIVRELIKSAKITNLPAGMETLFVLPAAAPPPHPGPGGGMMPPPPPPGVQ